MTPVQQNLVGRRRLLSFARLGMSWGAVGTVLVACGQPTAPTAAPTKPAAAATTAPQPAATTAPTAAAKPAEATKPAAATTAPAATTAAAAAKPVASSPVTIKWDTFRGVGTPWPEDRTKTFQAAIPDVKVELRPIPIPGGQLEAYPKMYAMFAANTLGDVFAFDPSHWEFYRAVEQGLLRPLDEYVSSDKYDLAQFFEPFVKFQQWNSKLWGLPSWGTMSGDLLIFNEVALQEAGVPTLDHTKPDWSMDQIYQAAVKLHKIGSNGRVDRYGINLDFGSSGAMNFSRAFNGDLLSEDGKQAALLEPNTTKALRWMIDLAVKEKVAALPGSFEGDPNGLFAAGKLGLLPNSFLDVNRINGLIKDPNLVKMKVALFPKRPDGRHPAQLRGGTWNVGAKSAEPKWGWEFIKHLASKDGILTFNTIGNNGSAVRPDVVQYPFFTANPAYPTFLATLATAWPAIVPANFRGTEYQTVFTQSFGEVYLGKIEFEPGIKKVNDAVQAVLSKPKA